MAKDTDELIRSIETDDGLARACEEVDAWARDGRIADLVSLVDRLEARGDVGDVDRIEAFADHVEDQIALARGPDAVGAVLSLARKDRKTTVRVPRPHETRVRAFASRLGYGQDRETFLAEVDRAGDAREHRELFACWLHELLLREGSLEDDPRAQRFFERLRAAGHPLATMPLALDPVEREATSYMPLYGDKGLGRAIARLERGPMSARTVPPPAGGMVIRATRKDEPEVESRLAVAVRPWSEGSNGKIEAKVFTIDPALDSGALGSWILRVLPIEATAGSARLDVAMVADDVVFGSLFAAAANGGAYSAGLGGAYGRRAAWTSLGALVGAAAGAPIPEILRACEGCAFLTFRGPGPWFYDVAWDLGVLCLRGDQRTAAVLAATDKD